MADGWLLGLCSRGWLLGCLGKGWLIGRGRSFLRGFGVAGKLQKLCLRFGRSGGCLSIGFQKCDRFKEEENCEDDFLVNIITFHYRYGF